MKSRALLMMPHFMGYDKILEKALSGCFEVDRIDNEAHLKGLQKRVATSISGKLLRHLHPDSEEAAYRVCARGDAEFLLAQTHQDKNAYQLVLCVNGGYVPEQVFRVLKKRNPKARFVLYLWDDAANLMTLRHQEYFLGGRYSFNLEDCERYGFRYLPVFTQQGYAGHANENIYDIAMIGTGHPDRLRVMKRIYEQYKDRYRFFIYNYYPECFDSFFYQGQPLDYGTYLGILQKSSAVMDIPFERQSGPTTRFSDAWLTDTKVITVNEGIENYPFYNENVIVIDRNNPVIPEDFIERPYQSTQKEAMTAEEWVRRILDEDRE